MTGPDASQVVERYARELMESDPTITGLGVGKEGNRVVVVAAVTDDPDRADRPRELEGIPVRYRLGGPFHGL